MKLSYTWIVAVLVVLVGVVPAVAFADDSGLRGRKFGEDGIEVGGWQSSVSPGGRDAAEGRGGPRSGERLSGSPVERICPPVLYTYGAYRQVITDCEGAGGTEYAPYFERVEGGPVDPREVQVQVITVTREEVQRIIVDSGELIVQPGRPWVLVNAETVAMTDAAERIVGTQVLEVDVEVRDAGALHVGLRRRQRSVDRNGPGRAVAEPHRVPRVRDSGHRDDLAADRVGRLIPRGWHVDLAACRGSSGDDRDDRSDRGGHRYAAVDDGVTRGWRVGRGSLRPLRRSSLRSSTPPADRPVPSTQMAGRPPRTPHRCASRCGGRSATARRTGRW